MDDDDDDDNDEEKKKAGEQQDSPSPVFLPSPPPLSSISRDLSGLSRSTRGMRMRFRGVRFRELKAIMFAATRRLRFTRARRKGRPRSIVTFSS